MFSNSSNDNVEDVLIKVTLLNAFYSTQLYNNPAANPKRRQHADILSMAQHIANEANFDAWLRSNDWQDNMKAVNYIAFGDSDWVKRKEPKGANAINDALSFATKYCNWHCPDKYPIVDAVAKGMLYYISKNKDVKLYIGLAAYRAGISRSEALAIGDTGWSAGKNILMRQVQAGRKNNKVSGFVFFRYDNMVSKKMKQELNNLKKVI